MKFVIATITYFNNIGFDTADWRKSIDGTKAIVHENFVKVLLPSVETDINVQVLTCPSAELDALLNSEEWTTKIMI